MSATNRSLIINIMNKIVSTEEQNVGNRFVTNKMAPTRVALLLSFWFFMASTTFKDLVNPCVNACSSV